MRNKLCTFGFILLAAAASSSHGAAARIQASDTSKFVVLLRGTPIGTEIVTVARTASGWIISSSGRQGPPIDLTTTRFEMTYTPDWQPVQLTVDGTLGGKPLKLSTSFGLTTAITEMTQGEKSGTATQVVSARTIVLPNNFYAGYEALAARLGKVTVGARLPAYVVPQAEASVTVDRITSRQLVGPGLSEQFRQFELTFNTTSGKLPVEIWIDSRDRMARLVISATNTVVIRDDIASVMAREQIGHRADDEQVYIPSERFNLAGTVTKPFDAAALDAARGGQGRRGEATPAKPTQRPAVILVPGSGSTDREHMVSGVPIYAEIAGALADSGFVVLRYDRRGLGQSGGRIENTTLAELADDAIRAVEWTRSRKDVDGDRVAVVSHGEGGAVVMLAAVREKRIAAVGLLAAPGLTGRETVLAQQRHALSLLPGSDADKQDKIALQSKILDAVITGLGWEGVPPAMRRSADTPLFKSWLIFDPAVVIPKIDRPLLILQGSLDMEVPMANADRLEELARRRPKSASGDTRKVVLPGINHLLAAAQTGNVDEYPTLQPKSVAPSATAALATWLKDALSGKK
jgi:pimeloyl-ACP methyl ester carboxylesterase